MSNKQCSTLRCFLSKETSCLNLDARKRNHEAQKYKENHRWLTKYSHLNECRTNVSQRSCEPLNNLERKWIMHKYATCGLQSPHRQQKRYIIAHRWKFEISLNKSLLSLEWQFYYVPNQKREPPTPDEQRSFKRTTFTCQVERSGASWWQSTLINRTFIWTIQRHGQTHTLATASESCKRGALRMKGDREQSRPLD